MRSAKGIGGALAGDAVRSMGLRRFWVSETTLAKQIKSAAQGETVFISGDLFHHIHGVCRLGVGREFELLVENAPAIHVCVLEVAKGSMQVQILAQRELTGRKPPFIHLALSIPKPSKVDWIVEKSVELGVSCVHLFTSDHSFFRQPEQISSSKLKRWEAIVDAACAQTGRTHRLQVKPPVTLQDVFARYLMSNRNEGAKGLFLYEGVGGRPLHQYMSELKAQGGAKTVWAFVGSEGGFSDEEAHFFKERDCPSLSLGDQVLRVETACLVISAIIKYELEDVD